MSKVKAAAMMFGGLTACMAGALFVGYVVSPTVGTAASRDVYTVTENMNGAVSYVPLENTVITDSSKKEKETDNAVDLSFDGGNNVENIRKTADAPQYDTDGGYKFAVTDIKPASYEEPVFVAESSVDIYSQYKGETPAVEEGQNETITVEEIIGDNQMTYGKAFSYINTNPKNPPVGEADKAVKELESAEFTIEEITEPEEGLESAEFTIEEITEEEEKVTETTEITTTAETVTEETTTVAVTEPVEEEVTEPETELVTTQAVVQAAPTVTTQYVAQTPEPEETQPVEEPQQEETTVIPLSDSEYIALCNAVAHEAGCNWISTRDKANVVEVIMNRVYSNLFPNSVIEVLTQQNQFTGAEGYAYLGYLTSDVSQDVIDAVYLYFSDPSSFNEGYLYFYGDGYQNHFSQGGWW